MTNKFYAERDLVALDKAGGHYCRHVSAMTGERLHNKSDIAAELGWRDMQIAELQRQLTAREATVTNLTAQVQGLAAENGRLKSKGREIIKEAAYVYSHYNRMVDHLDGETIDGQTLHELQEVIEKETPNTDAELAEIRVQGVDMAIEHLTKKFEGTGGVGVPVMALEYLASELRKEQGK